MTLSMTHPTRDLTAAGLTREKIVELGGKFSTSGMNVTFFEGDEGFAGVAATLNQQPPTRPAQRSSPRSCAMRRSGPAKWKIIHEASLRGDPKDFPRVVREVVESIPRGECLTHARAYIDANPLPNTTNDECWVWSFTFHDRVSERIGAKRFTIDEAREACGDRSIS